MFKKSISLFLCVCLIIAMTLCLCSCKDAKNDEYPVTIGDVTIEEEPLNIVVLSDCLADVISYMGYDVKMVGRSIECDQEFLSIVPSVGSAQSPDVKAIIASEADLVITEASVSKNTKNALDQAQIPVITLKRADSFENLKTLYAQLGAALGGNVSGRATGEGAYDELMTTFSDFENAIPSNVVKTACYLYVDENGTLCTLTKGTIQHEFFSHCGATNIFSEQEKSEVDLEQLKIGTPAYIFYSDENVLNLLNADDKLAAIDALTNGNTYQVKLSDLSRQGRTYEDLCYNMINFMFGKKATEDEATPDEEQTVEETTVGYVS
ncbi:MAG: ABC transporter substrate-binding protein [Ruminococcus sp.]|nr:ABC transporter substrate-binding protein [Ruminococcus sp.]